MNGMGSVAVWCPVSGLLVWILLNHWLHRGTVMPLDIANERSLHVGSVPRIGGVGIALGVGIPVAFQMIVPELYALLFIAGALALISLFDDFSSLPIVPRLAAHIAAAIVSAIILGTPTLALVPVVLGIAWMTNLYNFMDGADGLAGGMAVFGFGAYAAAAWFVRPDLASVSVFIAAANAGFLVLNFPPARVFMGDVGSVPLGFLAATLGIFGWRENVWPLWFPIVVFLPFIADASLTLVRRFLSGVRVWKPHREHTYQRLVLSGWSHLRLLVAAWSLMGITSGAGLWLLRTDLFMQIIGVICVGAIHILALRGAEARWCRTTIR